MQFKGGIMVKPILVSGVLALATAVMYFGSHPAEDVLVLKTAEESTAGKGAVLQAANPELVRLLALLEDYSTRPVEVYVDGVYRPVREFTQIARRYLAREFTPGQSASEWVRQHAYLSPIGNVMYFRDESGTSEPVRDAFLRELAGTEPPPADQLK